MIYIRANDKELQFESIPELISWAMSPVKEPKLWWKIKHRIKDGIVDGNITLRALLKYLHDRNIEIYAD